MEKQTQDHSSVDNKDVIGRETEHKKEGSESYNEDAPVTSSFAAAKANNSVSTTDTEDMGKANIKTGLNENKSTVSETSAPSESISDKKEK